MARFLDRLARAFSMIINILDPDVIVVGGGMSKHDEIYTSVPPLLRKYVYHREPRTPIVRAVHGDASGVRGAAMLWPVLSAFLNEFQILDQLLESRFPLLFLAAA